MAASPPLPDGYENFLSEVSTLLELARKNAARAIKSILVATYWELGRRIAEVEQGDRERADYGAQLLEWLSRDLTKKFGKGFSRQNLQYTRRLYTAYPPGQIRQMMSGDFPVPMCQSASGKSGLPLNLLAEALPPERRNPGQCLGFLALMRSRSVFPLSCLPDERRRMQERETTRQLLDERTQRKTGDA